jgi:hypothetical protein
MGDHVGLHASVKSGATVNIQCRICHNPDPIPGKKWQGNPVYKTTLSVPSPTHVGCDTANNVTGNCYSPAATIKDCSQCHSLSSGGSQSWSYQASYHVAVAWNSAAVVGKCNACHEASPAIWGAQINSADTITSPCSVANPCKHIPIDSGSGTTNVFPTIAKSTVSSSSLASCDICHSNAIGSSPYMWNNLSTAHPMNHYGSLYLGVGTGGCPSNTCIKSNCTICHDGSTAFRGYPGM